MDKVRLEFILLIILIGILHFSGVYVFPLWFMLLLPALGILINIGIARYERDNEKTLHE